MFFLPAAQFAYRKGLGCTDALLTLSHHLQKSLDAGMESYIVQFDFIAAFRRVSHSGLLLKLKSILLSICKEFLSNRRQRVVVDGAYQWVYPNRFERATGMGVMSSFHHLYQWNVWAGGEPTICLCWLLHITGGCSQACRRPAVPVSLTGTLQGFRSGAITGAWYWILRKLWL